MGIYYMPGPALSTLCGLTQSSQQPCEMGPFIRIIPHFSDGGICDRQREQYVIKTTQVLCIRVRI